MGASEDLVVLGQTSTPGFGGTFGQSVPAMELQDLISAGKPRSIVAVRDDASFRTNLILCGTTEFVSVDVDVTLVGPDGTVLGTKRYTLAAVWDDAGEPGGPRPGRPGQSQRGPAGFVHDHARRLFCSLCLSDRQCHQRSPHLAAPVILECGSLLPLCTLASLLAASKQMCIPRRYIRTHVATAWCRLPRVIPGVQQPGLSEQQAPRLSRQSVDLRRTEFRFTTSSR